MKKNKRKLKQSGRIRPITVAGGGGGKWPGVYPLEVRRQAVRLHVEEGIPKRLIAEELGLCHDSVADWVKRYRALGEAGLAPRVGGNRTARPRLPAAVPAAIVALKREHPAFGVRRIAQWLRRSLLLPGSAETVRQTLHRQALLPQAPPRKPKRNPPKPRFFERATPVSGQSKPASDGQLKTSHLDGGVWPGRIALERGSVHHGEPDQDGQKCFDSRTLRAGLVETTDRARVGFEPGDGFPAHRAAQDPGGGVNPTARREYWGLLPRSSHSARLARWGRRGKTSHSARRDFGAAEPMSRASRVCAARH